MKMKLTFFTAALVALMTFQTFGQTNAPASPPDFSGVVTSNLNLVIYGERFEGNGKLGGGGMLLYDVYKSDVGFSAAAGVGMDWAGSWHSLAGNVAGEYEYQVTSNLDAIAYGFTGIGTSLSGAGGGNGNFESVEGLGLHLVYAVTENIDLGAGAGYVERQGAGDYSGGAELLTASASYKSDSILFPIGKLVQLIGGVVTKQ